MKNSKRDRIIFLDLMRALAVLLMIEGHTIDTLLAPEFRDTGSLLYNIWFAVRGFTAPIFMFTAGTVFTYLLKLNGNPFGENLRVRKGIKRFFILLGLGYLLRYPTYRIFDFSIVSEEQWKIFFTVDALHLIAFGLFFIIILFYFAEKFQLPVSRVLIFGTSLFFLSTIFIGQIDWGSFFPVYLANYFTRDFGSLFPIIPYALYVIAGGVLGIYLADNKGIQREKIFSINILKLGAIFVLASFAIFYLPGYISNNSIPWTEELSLASYRLGIVLILFGAVSFLSIKVKNIPKTINLLGKHTLFIYVIHLVILYGSAWTPGLYKLYAYKFNSLTSAGSAFIMIFLMIGLTWTLERTNLRRKRKLAAANI